MGSMAVTTTTTMDMMKGWIEELVKKNSHLELEVNNLKSLANPAPGQEDLQSKIHALQQENMELHNQLQLKEMIIQAQEQILGNSGGGRLGQMNQIPRKRRRVQLVQYDSDVSSDQEIRIPVRLNAKTETTNPLYMEEILRHIMSYVKPMDLLNCRQVCKLWENTTKKDLQERMTFHITKDDLIHLKSFMDQAAKSFPMFQKLRLVLDCDSWYGNKKNVRELFTKYGKNLRYLNLTYGGKGHLQKNWNVDDFRDIILNSLDEIREISIILSCRFIREEKIFFPHHTKKYLESLTILKLGINCIDYDCNEFKNKNTQFFADLFRMAPNLHTLYWRSYKYGTSNFVQSLLQVNPPKLENLFFYSELAEQFVNSIANSQLKLKRLYLIDFKTFELSLTTSPSSTSEVTPGKHIYRCQQNEDVGCDEMKYHLEEELEMALNDDPPPSCTKLLQIFMAALAAKLN